MNEINHQQPPVQLQPAVQPALEDSDELLEQIIENFAEAENPNIQEDVLLPSLEANGFDIRGFPLILTLEVLEARTVLEHF